MDFFRWCFLILIALSLSSGFDLDDSGCILRQPDPDTTVIHCRSGNSSSGISVGLFQNQILAIRCENTLNSSDFVLARIEDFQISKNVNFESCQLPDSKQIDFIIRNLPVIDLGKLYLESLNMDVGLNLSRDILKNFKSINRLFLIGNNFTDIPSDYLEEFRDLHHLTLSLNNLEELPEDFLIFPNVQVFQILSNGIKVINSKTFSPLNKTHPSGILEENFDQIKPNLFEKLVSITNLKIKCEKLESLPANIFTNLQNLEELILEENNFSYELLDSDLLQNHNGLINFLLVKNKQKLITLPNRFLANMTNLREVLMSENGLVTLPEDLLFGTTNLLGLYLRDNDIKSIPPLLLKDCKRLIMIYFQNNQIEVLPDNIFSNLRKLRYLDLSNNRIKTISSSTFAGLNLLIYLKMEMNELQTIEFGPWFYKIHEVNFSHNNLTLQNYTTYGHPLDTPVNIFRLDFSHNHISHMIDDWFHFTKIKFLILFHNDFEKISGSDLRFMSKDIYIDMEYNKIKEISMAHFEDMKELDSSGPENPTIEVGLGGNPIECDCKVYYLKGYLERKKYLRYHNSSQLFVSGLNCQEPERLECLINETQTINNTCPDKCECWRRPSNQIYIIDCSNRGLDRAPEQIKAPAEYQIELNLTNNSLTSMPSLSQPGYDKVTVLLLAHNNIENITLQSLSKNLLELELHNNKLKKVDTLVFDYLKSCENLSDLTLHDNLWECNCEFWKATRAVISKIKNWKLLPCLEEDEDFYWETSKKICP